MKVKCPNCGETIDLSENEAAEIVRQVRTAEFDKEIESYKKKFEEEKKTAVEKALLKMKSEHETALNKKQTEVFQLRSEIEQKENEKELAVAKATGELNNTISSLKAEAKQAELKNQIAMKEALEESNKKNRELLDKKDKEIAEYKQEVEYYKDLKARKSTKAIGESLELYCQNDYDIHLRSLLPDAYFEKDNEISETGSKGDYIFREEKDGIPLLSIMFEMKNDSEDTEVRHKNEYFFKELDKDRREKGCEYAVLVSMLESDSNYYNQGIVDVSHRYSKMYVIRPQFLIPLITLLRNAALSAHNSKLELSEYKAQNIDVTNFEDKLEDFKIKFSKSCELTGKKFTTAIEQIDKAIKDLEKVKEALTASGKHLIAADNQLSDLTVKKLTYNNPTMKKKFANIKIN